MTRTYIYMGPPSGATLADGTEIMLWPGHAVTLPESDYTRALEAQGRLQPVSAPAQAARVQAPGKKADKPKE